LTGCQSTLAARLVDAETGLPIPSAWVWVEKSGNGGFPLYKPTCDGIYIVRTDADGRFEVPVFASGQFTHGVNAVAAGYGYDIREYRTVEINGRRFLKADIHSTTYVPRLSGNLRLMEPVNGPPTAQQIADAYPSFPAGVNVDDSLPLFVLWRSSAGKSRHIPAALVLPSSCGKDYASYREYTRDLRQVLDQ
jgi:hypothetical protein